ncbi:hypothetical protein HY375_03190 [Candidatus Berkelbacteria bacterium]|nr:hypothetical protein [Candidatus Berkelbacteria bacterium]
MIYLVALLFLLFLVAFGLYSVYAVHHLNEFGYSGDASQRILQLYIGFSGLVLLAVAVALAYGISLT